MAAGMVLPREGTVFLSVCDQDKDAAVEMGQSLRSMGFRIVSTGGTHAHLKGFGIEVEPLPKISEGLRPNILDLIADGDVALILNTATRKGSDTDEGRIRATAVKAGITMITTIPGARATVKAIAALRAGDWTVAATQDYFPNLVRPALQSDDESSVPGDSVGCPS